MGRIFVGSAATDRSIFVLGRQHSGNTMLTLALGRHSRLYGSIGESHLLEHAASIAAHRPGEAPESLGASAPAGADAIAALAE
jgi:hypothetical protein